jgi:methylenetetrahydrofolate dehydrogenase (NADP+) / methenyltetrahydrofolate cyclohydrolase
MKILSGTELVGFIKERQAHAVRNLRQSHGIAPKLVIIRTNPDPVVDSYMKLKTTYGEDILVDVDVRTMDQAEALSKISAANSDASVHGIIVQIPLPDPAQTDEILNAVSPQKDVDGLGSASPFDAPTPMAINWLLAGYNVELKGKQIVVVGHGRLVGRPLVRMWQNSGLTPEVVDKKTDDLVQKVADADILVCATGVPALITASMIKPNAVVVDAGVATDKNGLVGDVAADVRQMPDITITPEKGGVGPLTVAALFENVIHAARNRIV